MAAVKTLPPLNLDPGAVVADKANMDSPPSSRSSTRRRRRRRLMGATAPSAEPEARRRPRSSRCATPRRRTARSRRSHGVTLELRAGEVMCLAGENGAGKSTLIKILTGAIQRDSGEYLIDGEDIGNPSPGRRRARPAIGVVYQELSLLPDLSVGENLLMGHLPARRGITRPAELRRQAKAMLERVGLDWLDPDTEVATLSLATQQLVEIAKVLGATPRVLDLRRADDGAVGERDEGAARPDPPAARRGPRRDVRDPPPRGDVRDRRPGHGPARRRARHEQADERLRPGLPDRLDGRAQDRVAVPGVEPDDRRAAPEGPRPEARGRGGADRLRGAGRRDRRHRRPARLRPQRAAAGDLRRRPGRGGRHRDRRRAGAPRRRAPRGAGRARPAHRGPQAARAAARAVDPRERVDRAPRRDLALLDRRQASASAASSTSTSAG